MQGKEIPPLGGDRLHTHGMQPAATVTTAVSRDPGITGNRVFLRPGQKFEGR